MKRAILCVIILISTISYSQTSVEEAWTLQFPPGFDYNSFTIVDMGKDNMGNIYLAGNIYENTQNFDILLMKIVSTSFFVEWIAVYNGPANGDDKVDDLEIDNEGNCYVAGFTAGAGNYNDYLTIKYNSSGQQVWENTYNGSANYVDEINDLFVDNAGNVYVTGDSYEASQSLSNPTTIKYNSGGVIQWKSTYVDTTSFYDLAEGLVVDGTGNVYVFCRKRYTTNTQFLTIKYNSAGVEQWINIAGSAAQNELAQFIGIDNSGKITVGGTVRGIPSNDPIGYLIYKYNPDGSYAGGGNTYNSSSIMKGMVVSPQGNVYVTGISDVLGQSKDFVTVKYNSSGDFQWVKRFNYADYDEPSDIVIDGNENIFITGYSTIPSVQAYAVTVKYNSSGDSLWTNLYTHQNFQNNLGTKIILDESGDIYVAIRYYSGSIDEYELIKLNGSGAYQWAYNYKSFCSPNSIKEDTKGNIYITGFGGFNQSMWDYITMKCDSSGNIKWIRTYNGPANETDQANDIEIDSEGNVYVTGGSKGIGTDFDFTTIKYDSSGNEKWVVRYNGPAFDSDIAGYVSVDADDNVYVSGSSLGSNTSNDIATVKYNNIGQLQWVKRYNSTANGNDLSQGLEVDFSGNVFVTGTSDSTGTVYDYVTVKYNPSGNTEWMKRYNGPANDGDLVSSMSLDNSGNVYVTGWSFGATTNSDYATVKYNSSGTEQWAVRWDDPASSYDYANDIAVDENENVYVTGISQGMGTDNDYTTVKYNSLGQQQWAVPYNGQTNSSDIANNIALDYLGDIYVTGNGNNNVEYSTIKYDKQGVQLWRINFDYLNYQDTPTEMIVDNRGNVTVAGYSSQAGQEWIWSIVKYKQPGFVPSDVVEEIDNEIPSNYSLEQNYPNPFNPSTTIQFSIPEQAFVKLEIFNALGEKVTTLVSKELSAGNYRYEWDAENMTSGIYFYQMQTVGYSESKKMILLR